MKSFRSFGIMQGTICWLFVLLASASILGAETKPAFLSARPIWPEGRENEKNLFVGFRASFDAPPGEKILVRVTGSTLYRIFINGEFLGHGPARGPHGYFRVDELDVTQKVKPGLNVLSFEVAGYNVNSYYLLDQTAFLQAEVVAAEKVLASTAGKGKPFEAIILKERVQKVQRYSFQRPFSEAYRLSPGYDRWRKDLTIPLRVVSCAVQPMKALLPRRVPYSEFVEREPKQLVSRGEIKTGVKAEKLWKDRSLTGIGPKLGGYLEEELETIPSIELQTIANATSRSINKPYSARKSLKLKGSEYMIVDFGINITGFLAAHINCKSKTRLFLTFDEILTKDDVDFKRLGCVNIFSYELDPGEYDVESFEPYTLRYIKLITLEGECKISRLLLREYASPIPAEAHFKAADARLNRLFAAGRETFRQNAVDIFMDCPSRERAGWLCDSFFTSRVARDLTGKTLIEKNFFENFLLPKKFDYLPEGMLPMCYPADHNDGVFIPNWALWFVVELEEYLERSGDREIVEALRPRVLKLFDYFKQFKNEHGLLEKLESWVFVEWSRANEFVQDVNYPTNMLFAEALDAAGKMYGMTELLAEAEKIREVIRKQSFDGEFFVDNAVRKEGKLQVTRNHTEVCQYFAFFFDIATPESHPKLWQTLVKEFGPLRKQTKAFPEVHPANAFIGNMLRMELLSRYGLCQQLLDESIAYELYMADRTGTLWENDEPYASCNHGFASHGGVHVLYRDVLGISEVDSVNKRIKIRFTNLRLDSCEGSVPTVHGKVELFWHRDGQKLRYKLSVPKGYEVKIENTNGMELVEEK